MTKALALRELSLLPALVAISCCYGFGELLVAADVCGFLDDARVEEETGDLDHPDPEVLPGHPVPETRELA